ncbi:hypothetical protein ACFLVM_03510 [Chloroflexota bacterium]
MKTRKIAVIFNVVLIAFLLTSCGEPEKARTGELSEEAVMEDVSEFFRTPPQMSVDLSTQTFDDFDVPSIEIDIPEIELGSLRMDMEFDTSIDVPDIEMPASSTPTGAPPADWEPDEATCARFSIVPDCSYVPEQYRELCEKCKSKYP